MQSKPYLPYKKMSVEIENCQAYETKCQEMMAHLRASGTIAEEDLAMHERVSSFIKAYTDHLCHPNQADESGTYTVQEFHDFENLLRAWSSAVPGLYEKIQTLLQPNPVQPWPRHTSHEPELIRCESDSDADIGPDSD
jgi:hypothetical protein